MKMSRPGPVGVVVTTLIVTATSALSGCGTGDPPTGKHQAAAPSTVAVNPYLAAGSYAVTHLDPGQSDSFTDTVPRGTFHVDPTKMPRVVGGPVNIMTLASTDPNYRWVSSTAGPRYVDVSGGAFKEVASMDAPGVAPHISPEALDKVLGQSFHDVGQIEAAVHDDWDGATVLRIVNGVYSMVDNENNLYYSNQDRELLLFGLKDQAKPQGGIELRARRDFKPLLGQGTDVFGHPEAVVGVNMTYDGHVVVLGTRSLYVLDRSLQGDPQQIRFGDDETISNSMALDADGGIYVASDTTMHKVVWKNGRLSTDERDGAWISPYDFGRQPPTVKFGKGTGSTPTLMGFGKDSDELVVITDGSDQMKLVAFWRNGIPGGFQQKPGTKSNRIADQIQVTAGLAEPLPEFIQSEQSVVVDGYGAFVVQNIGAGDVTNKVVDVLASGPVTAPPHGVQRFEWDPKTHKWASVWARGDVVSTSMVPAVSTKTGMVFVNGYSKADGWEVTGLDWKTGETVHRTIFGQSNLGNGAYAIVEALPNGDLLFNSVGGPFRAGIAQ